MVELGEQDEMGEAAPARWWWARRVGIFAGVLVVAWGVSFWWWGWMAEGAVAGEIAKIEKRGEPFWPVEFNEPAVVEEENGAKLLAGAMGRMGLKEADAELVSDMKWLPLPVGKRENIERILASNERALAMAHEAAGKRQIGWGIDYSAGVGGRSLYYLWPNRHLGEVERLAALSAHERGDERTMLERVRDMIYVGNALDRREASLMTHMVALEIRSYATQVVHEAAPDLKMGVKGGMEYLEVRELLETLLDEEVLQKEFVRHMEGVRAFVLPYVEKERGRLQMLPWVRADEAHLLANYQGLVDAARAHDYQGSMRSLEKAPFRLPDNIWRIESVAESMASGARLIYTPDLNKMFELHFQEVADGRMAALALALRWYAVEHEGRRPKGLEELVPGYLGAVPVDPFSEKGEKIRYVGDGGRPRLYCVGVDGKDDGGGVTGTVVAGKPASRLRQKDVIFYLKREGHEDVR